MLIGMRLMPVQEVKQELKQKLALLCTVCDGDLVHLGANRQEVALFGHVRYGACPNCFAEIDKETQKQRGFRWKWTHALKRKLGLTAKDRVKKADLRGYFGIRPTEG
jgi:hypothetical protein